MKINLNTETKNNVFAFRLFERVITAVVVVFAVIFILVVYNNDNLKNAAAITDGDLLSGQRIACCVGWESDYLLTPREDITLLRYDSNADCILALSYRQVDAVAMDEITMQTVFMKTRGLERIPHPITSVGCTFYASYGAEEQLAEFNAFAADFVKSDEYQAYHDNVFSDDYKMAEIPEIENGKKLIVGYVPDSYPESYLDFTTDAPAGYGIEMIKRFAYACGYTIEWVETSDTAAFVQLSLNQIDFAACYVSDVSRDDTENSGEAHMTAPYFFADVYLMKISEGEALEIIGEIDV